MHFPAKIFNGTLRVVNEELVFVMQPMLTFVQLAGVALRAPPARRTMAFKDKEPSL